MNDSTDDLEFEYRLKPTDMEEFADYLLEFDGKALAWSDEAADLVPVGQIEGYRLNLCAARADGLDLDLFFDSINAELSEFKQAVCPGEHHVLSADDALGLENVECEGLVYVSKVLVDDEYRGHQIGTRLLRKMSEIVDLENSLVGLKAFPLADPMGQDQTPKTRQEIERVHHFYERLGFSVVSGDYMKKDGRTCKGPMRRRRARALRLQQDRMAAQSASAA